MKLSNLKNDVSTEDDGVWKGLPSFVGVKVKMRALASDAVQKARKRAMAQFRVELERKGEDADTVARRERANACVNLRLLRAAVADIDGVEDDDGHPIPLSDYAADLFADPPEVGAEEDLASRQWRYFRTDLWVVAAKYDEEAQAALAEAGKELPRASEAA